MWTLVVLVFFFRPDLLIGASIADIKGRSVVFDKPFSRIISLYGAHTENLYHLGCEDQVIGVSTSDTFPVAVKKKPRYSYHDGPEKFLAAKPDLVLIRPMIDNGYPKLIQRLERSGVVVVSYQPATIEKMYEYWRMLGMLTGKEAQATKMVDDFKNKIDTVQTLTRTIPDKKKVYFEAIHSRMKTFSNGAMPIFALETAGGINIAKDARPSRGTNIANYGKERILAKAKKIDIFLAQKGVMNAVTIEQIKQEPGFQVIKAVRQNQIYIIDEHIVSRPVPRLFEGIMTIGRILYPDLFHGKPI